MSGLSRIASTTTLSPCTTLKTPSGNPASLNKSAKISVTLGSLSDGFRINVFPQAIAFGNIQIGTITGKLKGVIPATTPSACGMEYRSIDFETCSLKVPLSKWGIPHENSTASSPLETSPKASSCVFPCSLLIVVAILSAFSSSNRLKRNITCARFTAGVAAHSGAATFATLTVLSRSVAFESRTCPETSPVEGLKTS